MSAKPAYEHWLKEYSDIQDHLPRLHDAAKGNVMEIGVRTGVSTAALLAGLEENGGRLFSVDIHHCPVFIGHEQWFFLEADTQTESDKVKKAFPKVLDVLFVDGDHSYEGALNDLRNFGGRAKRIFVHDTDCPHTFPGVRKAVDQFVSESKRKVTYYEGSFGMAEIV